MKKLSLKKTTLSRLNNGTLSKVKGGGNQVVAIFFKTDDCINQCTDICATRWSCPAQTDLCPFDPKETELC